MFDACMHIYMHDFHIYVSMYIMYIYIYTLPFQISSSILCTIGAMPLSLRAYQPELAQCYVVDVAMLVFVDIVVADVGVVCTWKCYFGLTCVDWNFSNELSWVEMYDDVAVNLTSCVCRGTCTDGNFQAQCINKIAVDASVLSRKWTGWSGQECCTDNRNPRKHSEPTYITYDYSHRKKMKNP